MSGEHVGSAGAIGLTLGLSLLHAALPNHWFPFVVVGRAQGWSRRRTLGVLALAGGGHVVATSLLGLAVWRLGGTILESMGEEWVHRFGSWGAGGLLVALGAFFIARQAVGEKHVHSHLRASRVYHLDGVEHEHDGEHEHHHHLSDRAAVATLFLALTFSPCEAVVAAFISGVKFGLDYVLAIAVGTSAVTVAAMFVLTWLTLRGLEKLRFPWLDRHEMALTGVILVAIGFVVLLLPS